MDHTALFRPVFAHVAHVAVAAKQHGWLRSHASAVRHDISLLLENARLARREPLDPNFDQAWFALTAWIHSTLARLPDGAELAHDLLPDAENRHTEFHRRLELLLTPLPGGYPDDILDIIRVYALCLDLGYRPASPLPGIAPDHDSLRQRCRDLLDTAPPPAATGRHTARTPRGNAAAAAVWLVLPFLPLVLYGLYRYFLGALYANVVG